METIRGPYESNIVDFQPKPLDKKADFFNVLERDYDISVEPSVHGVAELENLDFAWVDNNQLIEKFSGDLVDFLKLPKLIYKDINDHNKRRAIRDQIAANYPEHETLLTADRMKLNKFSTFHIYAQMILNSEVAKNNLELQDALMQFPTLQEVEGYKTMDEGKKNLFVERLERAALNFLKLFETKPKAFKKAA